mmetsp:Transcript_21051/g.50252  ORF Transcript_21051/g.50252 Transcript_21051/m.50252 type:complete len:207 (+) Transcript_21051:31-651(+)
MVVNNMVLWAPPARRESAKAATRWLCSGPVHVPARVHAPANSLRHGAALGLAHAHYLVRLHVHVALHKVVLLVHDLCELVNAWDEWVRGDDEPRELNVVQYPAQDDQDEHGVALLQALVHAPETPQGLVRAQDLPAAPNRRNAVVARDGAHGSQVVTLLSLHVPDPVPQRLQGDADALLLVGREVQQRVHLPVAPVKVLLHVGFRF